jgi:squalene synthase HpnC
VVIDSAYATCLRLARQHYENFPVASRLLPRALRPHVAAVYAFARVADDFADEGRHAATDRLTRLDDWRERLDAAIAGRTTDDGSDASAIFLALGETMRRFALEPRLFVDLLSAFRQDVVVSRYDTWDDVLDYCSRSANPVGRLVLRLAGHRDATLDAWSDHVCTALQLTNFWQDLAIDWSRGRLYVPLGVIRAHGADERDLDRGVVTSAWRAALGDAARITRDRFDAGRPVVDAMRGRLGWELRATWLGGVRVLDRLEASEFDVFARRPRLGWRDAPALAWGAAFWRRSPVLAL